MWTRLGHTFGDVALQPLTAAAAAASATPKRPGAAAAAAAAAAAGPGAAGPACSIRFVPEEHNHKLVLQRILRSSREVGSACVMLVLCMVNTTICVCQ